MNLNTIGKNIKKYRLANGLRQEDLALKSGLTANYISLVERGRKIPSLSSFIAILNALDISADVILADVLSKGYQVKYSILEEEIKKRKVCFRYFSI